MAPKKVTAKSKIKETKKNEVDPNLNLEPVELYNARHKPINEAAKRGEYDIHYVPAGKSKES